jgi:hypothetical protein
LGIANQNRYVRIQNPVSHGGADAEAIALMGAGDERVTLQDHEDAALRVSTAAALDAAKWKTIDCVLDAQVVDEIDSVIRFGKQQPMAALFPINRFQNTII